MAARGSGVSPSTRRSHRDRMRVSRKNTPCGPAAVRSPPGVQMQNDDPSTRVTTPPPVLVGSASGVQAPMSVVLWSSLRPQGRSASVGGSPPPGVRPLHAAGRASHDAIGRPADGAHHAAGSAGHAGLIPLRSTPMELTATTTVNKSPQEVAGFCYDIFENMADGCEK